ncbi:hypothetical protein MTO96_017691 [Rhipicephalus appendiculatus]
MVHGLRDGPTTAASRLSHRDGPLRAAGAACRTLQEEERAPVVATAHPATLTAVQLRHRDGTDAGGCVIPRYTSAHSSARGSSCCLMSVLSDGGGDKKRSCTGRCGWLALRGGSPQVCGTFPVCNERRREQAAQQRRREWRESEGLPTPTCPSVCSSESERKPLCGKGHRGAGRGAVGDDAADLRPRRQRSGCFR